MLVAESISSAYGGVSVATDRVGSKQEVLHIRDGVRAMFPEHSAISAAVPTSTSYLKLVDVPFLANDECITPKIVLQHIARSGVKDLVTLVGPLRVVQASRMSDTCTVYLNIADLVGGARAKALIGRSVQFG